jgi:hypothetical protein
VLALALALGVPLGSPARAETLSYVDSVVAIVDSLGRKVDDYEWHDSALAMPEWHLVVLLRTESRGVMSFGVNAGGWWPSTLYYWNADCSGDPLIRAWTGNAVSGKRDTVYVGTGQTRAAHVRSSRTGRSGSCWTYANDGAGPTDHEIPGILGVWENAVPAFDLRDWFEPPFAVRPRGARVAP